MHGTAQRRASSLTLVAMTLANSMILVDQTAVPMAIPAAVNGLHANPEIGQWVLTANILPLAALMVFGGRLGDLVGLRRIFLVGAVVFIASSALAGGAQSIEWLIAVRLLQGCGAALMMPTSMAIVSAVFPVGTRGRALGILAGGSAAFAAAGPVFGGALTEFIGWRAVFFVNVPLAALTVLLTLAAAPDLRPEPGSRRSIDYRGLVAFTVGTGALVLGLGQVPQWGAASAPTLATVAVGVAALAAFVLIERRAEAPLMKFGLFRYINFSAANISQLLAGAVELSLALLLPLYLLLILEMSPATAGAALIPATVPIIVVAPLAGRFFDRLGGRWPLTAGFLILALSLFWLAIFMSDRSYATLIPALVLQGVGLGIVLTVNDPVSLNAVPSGDRGQASGIDDTSEQLGGAIGIAALSALFLGYYRHLVDDRLHHQGVFLSGDQVERFRHFILSAEQTGLGKAHVPPLARRVLPDAGDAFVSSFELTMAVAGLIAVVGAAVCFVMVRRVERVSEGRVLSRRSRWVYVSDEGPLDHPAPLPDSSDA
jgi:EmrB/QacA subfamily drug resistance transporter